MKQTCYMCDKEATSYEHVPPKCLFPERKDLPEGISLRKELIKVPSCDLHNISKSMDDEYLLYMLCMNIANNAVAFRHFATKIMRAYERKPKLMRSIIKENHEVIAVDRNGTAFNTLMVKADMARIHKCFNQIARALYFHEFKEKFRGQCKFLHDFTIKEPAKFTILVKEGDKERSVLEHVKRYFMKLNHKGSNPSVFRYLFDEPDERGLIALSMQFYGGSHAFIAFIPKA